MTMASRVLGFFRDVLMASLLGTGPIADAFVVAFRFPNLFRRLFGEGAFNSAFVPLFAKRLEGEGPDKARGFAEEAFSGLFFVLLIFLALAELAMPLLMYLFAPGFAEDPEKFNLTILLTRIAFPYLLFMSLVALLGGVLNSLNRFLVAAAAPVVLNVVMISVLLALRFAGFGESATSGQALVWAVSFAGLLQFIVLYIAAAKAGMKLRLRKPSYSDGMKRMVMLGIPGVIAGGITQLNLVISTIIASHQASAASWLYYADRIYQLPLGVVGVAIGIVLLPEISRQLRKGDNPGVFNSQNRAIELSLFLTVPASIALVAIPYPIIQVLFQHGAFTQADTQASASALAAFAAGLPAFVLIKIFSPGFFAREDTKTPMYFAGLGVVTNIAGALILFPYIGHVGIALATTVAGWLNALLLGVTLNRRGFFKIDDQLKFKLPRILASSLIMGVFLLGAIYLFQPYFEGGTAFLLRVGLLASMVILGAVIYFGLSFLTGAFSKVDFRTALKRK